MNEPGTSRTRSATAEAGASRAGWHGTWLGSVARRVTAVAVSCIAWLGDGRDCGKVSNKKSHVCRVRLTATDEELEELKVFTDIYHATEGIHFGVTHALPALKE